MILGRAPGCALRLANRAASAEHASIFWTGERWEVRDLGSRNGTYVEGRRLGQGERAALREGAELLFGGGEERWVLVDALGPVASARCRDTGGIRVAEDGLLLLPSGADPMVSVFEAEGGRWLVEADGPARPAVDQELIMAGSAWLLSVPPLTPEGVVSTTRNVRELPIPLSAITLRFDVSRDEEYVRLSICVDQGSACQDPPIPSSDTIVSLGARAHNELLLALARARIEAREDPSLSPGERGWLYVDDVISMLRSDAQRLSVSIFRARQQLASAGVLDAGAIIERRSTTRQIRLGIDRIDVRTL